MRRLKLILILSLSQITFSLNAQTIYFPPLTGTQWETINPSQLNWCVDSIPSLIDFIGSNNTKAFIVLIDGKIVLENYYGSFKQDSFWYWASAGKSMLASLVGIAQEKKYLSINDSTYKYLNSGWTSCSSNDEQKIKIVHQLSMSTGLHDDVLNLDCTDPACLHCIANPGTRWAYHNAPYTLLEDVIVNSSNQTLNQFLNINLKNKIGMNGLFIKQGYNNVYFSNARSMARFGLLAMNNFIWNTDTILKDENYKNQMINTSQNINLSYGYLWWLNGKSSFMLPRSQFVFNGALMSDAPSDLYAALGKNGQFINIVPSKKIVLIRMGEIPGDQNELPITFNNEIWKRLNNVMCNLNGVNDQKNHSNIYPNPTSDYITIGNINSFQEIKLYNSMGNELSFKINQNQIDLRDLEKGIYILKLKSNTLISTSKIIIQ